MKHLLVDDSIKEHAALYALGAMGQREANAFEDHLLEGCSVCAREAEEFDMVIGTLGFASPMVTPRREVRSLLVERIGQESRSAPDLTGRRIKTPPRKERRFFIRTDFLQWALAASLAVLALISFQSWRRAGQTISDMQKQMAALSNEADGLRSGIDAERRRVKEMEQISQILMTPGSRIIKLEGREIAPSSSAEIYWDTHNRRWAVTLDMPPAPEGKVYQLWFITRSTKVSAGLIESDQTGRGYSLVDVPSNVNHLIAAAVTLEPQGGSLQPTMPIYALGKVEPAN